MWPPTCCSATTTPSHERIHLAQQHFLVPGNREGASDRQIVDGLLRDTLKEGTASWLADPQRVTDHPGSYIRWF